MQAQPFILTLRLDEHLAQTLSELRSRHFPPERNFIPAHVTLFHALPSEHEAALRADLSERCSATPAFDVALPRLQSWGKGVFLEVEGPELLTLRRQLAAKWEAWLTPQDRQGYRPHVTVQNKVPKDEAQALYASLAPHWRQLEGQAQGLDLWRYAGGPWTFADSFNFVKGQ